MPSSKLHTQDSSLEAPQSLELDRVHRILRQTFNQNRASLEAQNVLDAAVQTQVALHTKTSTIASTQLPSFPEPSGEQLDSNNTLQTLLGQIGKTEELQRLTDHFLVIDERGVIWTGMLPLVKYMGRNHYEYYKNRSLYRGRWNHAGVSYYNPWHDFKNRIYFSHSKDNGVSILNCDFDRYFWKERQKQKSAPSIQTFQPEQNISNFSLLRTPVDNKSVTISGLNEIHQQILEHLGNAIPIPVTAFEDLFFLYGKEGIKRFKALLTPPIDLTLIKYFTQFEQLSYFVNDNNYPEIVEATKVLSHFNHDEIKLFERFIGNMGESRQPLDKLVQNFAYFISCLNSLDTPGNLGKTTHHLVSSGWKIPPSGSDPAVLMDAMLYLFTQAHQRKCLPTQLACLHGLTITGFLFHHLFTEKGVQFICEEMRPRYRLTLENIKTVTVPSKQEKDAPPFAQITQWTQLRERFLSSASLFMYLASQPIGADRFQSLRSLVHSNVTPTQSVPLSKLGFVICLANQIDTPLNPITAQKLLDQCLSLNDTDEDAIATFILEQKTLRFKKVHDIQEFFETLTLFKIETLKPHRRFWFDLWAKSPNTALFFYDLCKPRPVNTDYTKLEQSLRLLKALIENPAITLRDYEKACLAGLCLNPLVALQHVATTRSNQGTNVFHTLAKQILQAPIQYRMNNQIDGPLTEQKIVTSPPPRRNKMLSSTPFEDDYSLEALSDAPDFFKIQLSKILSNTRSGLYKKQESAELITLTLSLQTLFTQNQDMNSLFESWAARDDFDLNCATHFLKLITAFKEKDLSLLFQMLTPLPNLRLRLAYCNQLASARFPLHHIEAMIKKTAQYNTSELDKTQDFITFLTESRSQPVDISTLETFLTHPLIHLNHPKHLRLARLLLTQPSSRFNVLMSRVENAATFESFIEPFINTDANSSQLTTVLCWALQSATSNEDLIFNIKSSTITGLLRIAKVEFQKLEKLYQHTTPSWNNIEQYAEHPDQKTLDELIFDPRGGRTTRKQREGDVRLALIKSSSQSKSELHAEIDHLRYTDTEELYNGKAASQLSHEELQSLIKRIKLLNNVTPDLKLRALFPLVEEALFYSTGFLLNETQRAAILNAFSCNKKVHFQEIATGEGKSIIDAMVGILLALAFGDKVAFTTSSLVDAARDFTVFKKLYAFLDINAAILTNNADKDCYQHNTILYSTPEEIGLYWLKYGRQKGVMHRVANEIDSLFDNVTPLRLAEENKLFALNSWLYQVFNTYWSRYPFKVLTDELVRGLIEGRIKETLRTITEQACQEEEKERRSTIIDNLTTDQIIALLSSASIAARLELNQDYKVLIEPGTGIAHVHPIIMDRAVPTTNVHFSRGVHQCLCARINAGDIKSTPKLPTVHLPAQTSTAAQADNVGFLRASLGQARFLGSSATIIGTEDDIARYTALFGEEFVISVIPEHKENQCEMHPEVLLQNKDLKFAHIYKTIKLRSSQPENRTPPHLVYFNKIEDANTFEAYLRKKDPSLSIQVYDADSSKEEQFIAEAIKTNKISICTPALSRNTDFKPREDAPLNIICASPFPVRTVRQIMGRTARNGQKGSFLQILTTAEKNEQRQLGDIPSQYNPLYRFFSDLSLSPFWQTVRNLPDHQTRTDTYFHEMEIEWAEYLIKNKRATDRAILDSFKQFIIEHPHFEQKENTEKFNVLMNDFYQKEQHYLAQRLCKIDCQPLQPTQTAHRAALLSAITQNASLASVLKAPNITVEKVLEHWLAKPTEAKAERQFLIDSMTKNPETVEADLFKLLETAFKEKSFDELNTMASKPMFVHLFKSPLFGRNSVDRYATLKQWFVQRVEQEIKSQNEPNESFMRLSTTLQALFDKPLLDKNFIVHIFDNYKKKSFWHIEARRHAVMTKIEEQLNSPNVDVSEVLKDAYQSVLEGDVTEQSNRFFKSLHRFGKSRFLNSMDWFLALSKVTHPHEKNDLAVMIPQTSSTGIFGGFKKVMDRRERVTECVNLGGIF